MQNKKINFKIERMVEGNFEKKDFYKFFYGECDGIQFEVIKRLEKKSLIVQVKIQEEKILLYQFNNKNLFVSDREENKILETINIFIDLKKF